VEYLKGRSDHFGGLLKLKFVLWKEKVKVWNGFSWLKLIFSDSSMKLGISSVAQQTFGAIFYHEVIYLVG
jgi:hypothetical protein